MKFLASKKLSDNPSIRIIILWLLLALGSAMILNLVAKGIEFGYTPAEWVTTVKGDESAFIDPMLFSDLLLGIHADLFGLIITFILVGSLYVRTSRSKFFKISLFSALILSLLVYPIGLLASGPLGSTGVVAGIGGFAAFHCLILLATLDLLIVLALRRL